MIKVLLICLLSLVIIPNDVVGILGRINNRICLHNNKNLNNVLLVCSNDNNNGNDAILTLRGGSDESDDESSLEETDEEDEEEDTSLTAMDIGTSTLRLLGKVTYEIMSAIHRAITAGMTTLSTTTTEEEEEESGIISKLMTTLSNMMTAAFDTSYSVTNQVDDEDEDEDASTVLIGDARTALVRQYKIPQIKEEDSSTTSPIYQSSSFRDVLSMARSKARLLVVVVPNNSSEKKNKNELLDQMVMKSFLSSKVSKVAEQSSRKKSKKKQQQQQSTNTYGSFLLYTPSSTSISKFTKLCKGIQKPSNSKSPLLLVIYPAQVMDSSTGRVKIIPKVLAQHHCNPPPKEETMMAWLNALRKRHAKQYASMQLELKELALMKERTQGYTSSIQSDLQRQQKEEQERQDEIKQQQLAQEHMEQIQQRRLQLKESLPDEPTTTGTDTITIALRFITTATTTTSNTKRKFDKEIHTLGDVFNWIDAIFEIERETISLTTMSNPRSFTYDEHEQMTLKDAGFSKMTALRVSELILKDNDDENDDDEEES